MLSSLSANEGSQNGRVKEIESIPNETEENFMNKTLKKLLSIVSVIMMLFCSVPMANLGFENLFAVKAEAITGVDIIPTEPGKIATLNKYHKVFDDFVYVEWDYDEDGIIESVEILKYMGNKETVLVPETIKELPVVSLGQYSFSPLYIEDDYYNPEAVNISKNTVKFQSKCTGT